LELADGRLAPYAAFIRSLYDQVKQSQQVFQVYATYYRKEFQLIAEASGFALDGEEIDRRSEENQRELLDVLESSNPVIKQLLDIQAETMTVLPNGAFSQKLTMDAAGLLATVFNPAGASYVHLGNDRASHVLGAERSDVLTGRSGNDLLQGNDGDDTLVGGKGDDTLGGGSGNDRNWGSEGNDYLVGGIGSDLVFGGTGVDTAVYDQPAADYHLVSYGGTIGVLSVHSLERDRLQGIEKIEFADKMIDSGSAVPFNALEYIARYRDLMAASGVNGIVGLNHFIDNGFAEGRRVTFDSLCYIASYGDFIQSLGSDTEAAARHYVRYGAHEGREATFDALKYIASCGDLIRTLGDNVHAAEQHWIEYGSREGRLISFDSRLYLSNCAGLRVALGQDQEAATEHYIQHGFREGRDVNFNP